MADTTQQATAYTPGQDTRNLLGILQDVRDFILGFERSESRDKAYDDINLAIDVVIGRKAEGC